MYKTIVYKNNRPIIIADANSIRESLARAMCSAKARDAKKRARPGVDSDADVILYCNDCGMTSCSCASCESRPSCGGGAAFAQYSTSSWTCSNCTLINDVSKTRCDACGDTDPGARSERRKTFLDAVKRREKPRHNRRKRSRL